MQKFKRNEQIIEWDPEHPNITCLMAVYNGEKYVREAINSILEQSYTNFEFLILDDGSTDATTSIIQSYTDQRIRLVRNNKNIGLTKSLNRGIDLAKGDFIARMDADDISHCLRFQNQIDALSSEVDDSIIGCGSNAIVINESGEKIEHLKKPSDSKSCGICHTYENAFIHGTMFVNKEVLVKNKYDENFSVAQDYELWFRLTFKGFRLFNIDKELLLHRDHARSIEGDNRNKQLDNCRKVREKYLLRFKDNITTAVLSHNKIDQTISCISKVNHQNVRVQLLDNASSLLTKILLYIYSILHKQITVEFSDSNLGVAKARNYQIKNIDTSYILFLDNDIQISDHFFSKLFKEYMGSSDYDGWTIKLFNEDQSFYQKHYCLVDENDLVYRKKLDGEENTNLIIGGALLIRKNIYNTHGPYDENMFVGYEDYEFSLRAMRSKEGPLKIFPLKETEALHTHMKPLFSSDKKAIIQRYNAVVNQNSINYINKKYNIKFNERVEGYVDNALYNIENYRKSRLRRAIKLLYQLIVSVKLN